MKWTKFLLGIGIGITSAYFVNKSINKGLVPAEKALNTVKAAFKEKGPIDGSWIHMVPETFSKFDLDYTVYHGGISRTVNDQLEQYEFYVDANSGTIIDIIQTSPK